MDIGCVTFDMKHRKKQKTMLEIMFYQAGMTWWFIGI